MKKLLISSFIFVLLLSFRNVNSSPLDDQVNACRGKNHYSECGVFGRPGICVTWDGKFICTPNDD